jgi:hypothetical protein
MSRHRREEHMWARPQALHAYGPTPQIGDAPDALMAEQLETSDVDPRNDRDRRAGIDRDDERRRKVQTEINVAIGDRLGLSDTRR